MYFKKMYHRLISDIRKAALNDDFRLQIQYRYMLKILFLLTIVSSFLNLITERYTMAVLMFLLTILYFAFYWIVYHRKKQGVQIVTAAMVITSTTISVFMLVHGTTESVSAMWILLYPIISFLLTGRKIGMISSVLPFIAMIFLFWTPIGRSFLLHDYNPVFLERYPIIYFIMMVISFFYETLRSISMQELKNQHERIESVYGNQYSTMTTRIADVKRSRHDVRHHIVTVNQLLNDNQIEEAKEYMNQYYKSIPFEESLTYCDHYATNALLTYYSQIAANDHIPFSVQISLPSELPFRTDDLTVIFGNLLENAVQACMADIQENESFSPWIKVEGKYKDEELIVSVENTSAHLALLDSNNHYKSTKHEGSGIGIQSVQTIVEKYDGLCTIKQEQGTFTVRILMNAPDIL